MNAKQITQRLLTGSALRVISLVSSVLVAFFMLPFLVHSLGDEQYGLWVVVGSFVGFYGFFDFGLSTAVGRYVSSAIGKNSWDEASKVTNTSFSMFFVLGIIVVFLSFIGAGLISYFNTSENSGTFALLFLILGCNIAFQFPMRTFSGVLSSQLRFDLMAYIEMFKLFTRTGLIVLLVTNGYGIVALAVSAVFADVVTSGLELFLVWKNAPNLKFGWKYFEKGLITQLIQYSWAAFLTNISEIARFKLIPIFVATFINLSFVVVYSIAQRLLEYFELLMRNAIGFMMPVISRFEGEDNPARIKKAFEYTTILTLIVTMFIGASIAFYGKSFINLWMGEEYFRSYEILIIMLFPIMMCVAQFPGKDLLFAVSKHKVYAFLSAGSVVAMSILALVLFHSLGNISIAVAFLLGSVIFEVIKPYFVSKALGERPLKVYMLYSVVIIKSLGLVIMLPALVIYVLLSGNLEITSYLDMLTLITIQGIIAAALAYFFVLPKELRSTINTAISPIIKRAFA